MDAPNRPLAVVTGASSGIGFELAVQCARHGHDLVVAADRPLGDIVGTGGAYRAQVQPVETDLSTMAGVDALLAAIGDRPVDVLVANAGQGMGDAFLEQPFDAIRRVIDTNVTGTLYLLHALGRRMRERGSGRILVTGSIAGYMPGTFNAVYNSSKAFIDSFAAALRNELQGSGVTVTCLMPGATDTPFFERAGLQDTKLAAQKKDDPAMVARLGYDAMAAGEPMVVTGLRNKLQVAAATITPSRLLAAAHRKLAQPGSAGRGAGIQRSPAPDAADASPAIPDAAAEAAEPKRRGSRPTRATKSPARSRASSGRTPADPGRP